MAPRSRRVVWALLAHEALDEVVSTIAEESPQGAVRVLELALDTAASLDQIPARGRVVPKLSDPDLRELFVFSYRLIYHVTAAEVQIVAFLHGARDFEEWAELYGS